MKIRKVIVLICSYAMLLTGCVNVGDVSDSGIRSAGQDLKEAEEKEKTAGEEIYTVRVWGYGTANTEDVKAVGKAISEITREKIGVDVDFTLSSDTEKLQLALTSGEKIDLVSTHSTDITSLISMGCLMEVNDLYEEYAPEAYAMVSGADLKCGIVDGGLYILPANNDNARSAGFCMRKDIVDELGIDWESIKTMEDMHVVLTRVKEAYPDIYPLVPSWAGGGMQSIFKTDNIAGNGLAVIEDVFSNDTQLISLYETEEYEHFVTTMYQWQQEGLVMPDATTTTDNNPIATVGFASYENIIPGVKELTQKKATGIDCVFAEVIPPFKSTDLVAGNFAIASACENPEKAMAFYNLMYTDPEVSNLFVNGLEGVHWQYADDAKNFITYPEGVTINNTGYPSVDWAWPNGCITPVWDGGVETMWEDMMEFNETAAASPALGFRFDSADVMSEITACKNVISEYDMALKWGMLNPEEALPKFNEELKVAGIDAVITEAQSQLDAYLADK